VANLCRRHRSVHIFVRHILEQRMDIDLLLEVAADRIAS
jgi:hypothetical protein